MLKEKNILLVEDNEGDIVLTMQALKDAQLNTQIAVAKNGEEAIQYLQKEGKYKDEVTPDLILLDLNLPKISGQEVLAFVKNNESLKYIPVVVLTTSDSEKDILEAYRNHSNCYITKSSDFQQFIDAMTMIKNFWFGIVELPNLKKYENRN